LNPIREISMTTSFPLRLAALALAVAAGAAGASQIQGTGIGAVVHETVAGSTTWHPDSPAKDKAAKAPAKAASSVRK
jgi:hypothetical protein